MVAMSGCATTDGDAICSQITLGNRVYVVILECNGKLLCCAHVSGTD